MNIGCGGGYVGGDGAAGAGLDFVRLDAPVVVAGQRVDEKHDDLADDAHELRVREREPPVLHAVVEHVDERVQVVVAQHERHGGQRRQAAQQLHEERARVALVVLLADAQLHVDQTAGTVSLSTRTTDFRVHVP